MKKLQIFLLLVALLPLAVLAQQTPAADQTQSILITGAKAHLGNGEVIENSAIAIEAGKLTVVADARTIRIDGSKYPIKIDATGKHVYPGFIAPNTTLGLVEIDAVRATNDMREVGSFNPSLRSIIAYNTDSDVTPTVRSNGVLLAQITPKGGRVSGQSSIVELDGWNWEDAAYAIDEGLHLNWPRIYNFRGWWSPPGAPDKNENYKDQKAEIVNTVKEALAYSKQKSVKQKNLKLEAMRGLFDKSKTLFVHTDGVKTMTEAILFAKEYDLRLVIVGGKEAWMITDLLKENNVPVIIGNTQSLPSRTDSDIDQPFKSAAALQAAGVLYCFSMDGAWEQRNLPFQAGQAVGYNLDYEDAIAALSLNTAKVLGIDKTVGSLEVGKDATLFISEGDVLDMRTNKISAAFIQGKSIDVDNKQKALYRKFKKRYDGE